MLREKVINLLSSTPSPYIGLLNYNCFLSNVQDALCSTAPNKFKWNGEAPGRRNIPENNNPAHGRHQLSRPMRIVGPIQI